MAGGVLFGLVSRALDNVPGLHALGPGSPLTDRGTDVSTGLFFTPTDWTGLPTGPRPGGSTSSSSCRPPQWRSSTRRDVLS